MRIFVSLALGLVVTATAAQAQAGFVSRLSNIGLTQSDINVLNEAARSLYVAQSPRTGAKTQWENKETGARGQVDLTDVDGNCVSIRHIIRPLGADASAAFTNRRCKTADGTWQLAAQ